MLKGHNKFKTTLDNHDFMTEGHIAGFLRNHGTGVNNLGRRYLGDIINLYDNPVVVDAACGTCVNFETFKSMGVRCQYIGVDRTQGMLDESAKRYQGISVMPGYVQELPLEDASADIVIMRHILEHLEEGYEDAIREGLRVANKELVLVFFLDPFNKEEDDISESKADEDGCTYFWNTYSRPKLMRFLIQFGYQIKGAFIQTPGAAHADTIVRIVK